MSDLISRLADTSEHDLDDLARLTHRHYQQLIDRGAPPALAATLARDLHTTWLTAIYGAAVDQQSQSLAAIVGNQPALENDVLALG